MRYEFAGFHLDAESRRLTTSSGGVIDLPPRALDALLLFVERPGILRDRRSLVRTLWPDTRVEDNSLDQLIAQLRKALAGGDANAPVIATERGRGFRFIAPVRCAAGSSHDSSPRSRIAHALHEQALALTHRPAPSNLEGAFGLLTAALEHEPHYAPALAERALLRTLFPIFDLPMEEAVGLAEAEARLALQIDPHLARAHHAMAHVLISRRRWVEARQQYDAACLLETKPDAVITRTWMIAATVGHLRLALEQAVQAEQLMPLEPLAAIGLAAACNCLGMHVETILHAERAATLGWPRQQAPLLDLHFLRALRERRYAMAADCIRAALGPQLLIAGYSGLAEQIGSALEHPAGRRAAATALQAFIARHGAEGVGLLNLKRAFVWLELLDARDAAFRSLDRTLLYLAARDSIASPWDMLWYPEMAAFRADRRFQSVVDRFGFRDYWRVYGPPDELAG